VAKGHVILTPTAIASAEFALVREMSSTLEVVPVRSVARICCVSSMPPGWEANESEHLAVQVENIVIALRRAVATTMPSSDAAQRS
jgi:hypothetical protein